MNATSGPLRLAPIGASQPEEGTLFYANLTSPPRSAGRAGGPTVIGFFAVSSLVVALAFATRGLWPVAPCCLVAAGLLALGFWTVSRRSAAFEEITVRLDGIHIRASDGRHRPVEVRLPTAWTRLERDIDPEFGCQALRLRNRQRCATVASLLPPSQRQALGDALEEALRRARRGGVASQRPVADQANPWRAPG